MVFVKVSIVSAEAYVEETGRIDSMLQNPSSHKWSKLHLHLQGMWSVITPSSVNCFHTLPNNINFPQKSLSAVPVSDGMVTGAS